MKKISLLLITLALLLPLNGCWDRRELEDNTFVILMGIDQADAQEVIVTIAFPLIQIEKGGTNQGEDNGSGNYTIMSVKAPTVIEGLNMFSTKISGPLALYTVKTLVISEEIAKRDMIGAVFSSWRYKEIRNTTNVLISECKAYEFIEARINNPVINPLLQEELLIEQINDSSYYKPVQLLDLMINLKSNSQDSVAMYGGISPLPPEKAQSSSDSPSPKANQPQSSKLKIQSPVKNGYLPSEIPIQSDNRSQVSGLAVMQGSKMVGVLNSAEAQTYAMLTQGKGKQVLTLPDPLETTNSIVVGIIPSGHKIKTSFHNSLPVFDISIKLNCSIECIQSEIDYALPQNFDLLTEYIQQACLENMQNLIIKIQKEYNADILKLGNKLAYHFLTVSDWETYNWPEKYKDAQINLDVRLNNKHAGILLP